MIDNNTVKNPNNIKRDFSTLSKDDKIENSDSPNHDDLNKIEKKIKIEQKSEKENEDKKLFSIQKKDNEEFKLDSIKLEKKNYGTIQGVNYEVPDNFEIKEIIGRGAFGIVFSAYEKNSKQFVAIKKIPNVFADLDEGKRILREIKLLKFFKHKNIINLIDVAKPDNSTGYKDIYLILELMRSDLHRLINSPQVFSEKHIKNILFQILNGVHFLHSADIIHRDLKPNNLLVSQNCDLKIADLGLARKYEEINNITDYVVTRYYRAPEIMLSASKYTKSIDIWSIGCIFAELMGRTPIFPGKHYLDQLERIIAVMGTPKREDLPYELKEKTFIYIQKNFCVNKVNFQELYPNFDALAIDLLEKMLVYNPEKRYTALQCLEHSFFDDLKEKRKEIRICNEVFNWKFDNQEYTRNSLQEAIYNESGFLKNN